MERATENSYQAVPGSAVPGSAVPGSASREAAAPLRRWPYYGWVVMFVAAWAMVATLPGRSMGLGLIVEPMLESFDLDRVQFAWMNLASVLIGATFCVPIGAMLDRWGPRIALAGVTAGLGGVVVLTAGVQSLVPLALLLTLTRGLGECSLSVLSIALVGKWFSRRLSMAMGIYSVLMALGFVVALKSAALAVEEAGWREAWSWVGWSILAPGPLLALLLLRGRPQDSLGYGDEFAIGAGPGEPAPTGRGSERHAQGRSPGPPSDGELASLTLAQALSTRAFWCYAPGVAMYGLMFSAISMFNKSLLLKQGFADHRPEDLLSWMFPAGIAFNLIGGWLGRRVALGRLLGAAILVLAGTLALFPTITTWNGVIVYGVIFGGAGGVVTVAFFSIWAQTFGRDHLGKIQGAAQICSVLASAAGPLLLAKCHEQLGGYEAFFQATGIVAAALGLACIFVRAPKREPARDPAADPIAVAAEPVAGPVPGDVV